MINVNDPLKELRERAVLDSLYRNNEAQLDLFLKRVGMPPLFGRCFGLGKTIANSRKITSYYKNIICDMDDLPFAYAYGVHLAHEYANEVGYCHTDHIDDVAEKVGIIAYRLTKRWYESGRAGF